MGLVVVVVVFSIAVDVQLRVVFWLRQHRYLGDFISQIYQGRNLNSLDLPRSFRSGAAGFIGHGPLCHYWMLFMVLALSHATVAAFSLFVFLPACQSMTMPH